MLLIGLTGGIGSGKSTVAASLAARGAVVLDADRLAREVVRPSSQGLDLLRQRFGDSVLGPDGALDRAALGRLVFGEPAARADLEGITHPLIARLTAARLAELPPDSVVVHDVPLLVELGYAPRYHLVVVVGASKQVREERLVRDRGLSREDARARIGAQADDDARRAVADAWLDNDGAPAALLRQVEDLHAARLLPFHANLEAGRPARPSELVPPTAGEDPTGRPARVLARLRWALGDGLLGADVQEWLAEAPSGSVRARLQVAGPDAATAARRLAETGFAAAGPGRHASCDPGRPAEVRLHTR